MKKVRNTNGHEYEVIEKSGDYTLLKSSNKYNPWIVVWNMQTLEDGKVTWGQGYYLETEERGRELLAEKTNKK